MGLVDGNDSDNDSPTSREDSDHKTENKERNLQIQMMLLAASYPAGMSQIP